MPICQYKRPNKSQPYPTNTCKDGRCRKGNWFSIFTHAQLRAITTSNLPSNQMHITCVIETFCVMIMGDLWDICYKDATNHLLLCTLNVKTYLGPSPFFPNSHINRSCCKGKSMSENHRSLDDTEIENILKMISLAVKIGKSMQSS